MAIFLTGSTGYIGAHILSELLATSNDRINVLVRAKDQREAEERLWHAMQLHLDFPKFHNYLNERISIFRGDLTDSKFGLDESDYSRALGTTDSMLHCAASLNRKSEKNCMNVNLRGTLEMIQMARRIQSASGLRRFSFVSTVAVAGKRENEVVAEDASIDWNRSDYDPYARTKKFCEHMVHELLPDVQKTIFRPSIVLGDTRYGATTQFDMVRAFVFLASLPVLPLRPDDRIEIIPVDYVAKAIAALHQKEKPLFDTYHLSSGTGSETCKQITDAIAKESGKSRPIYTPFMAKTFTSMVNSIANRSGNIGRSAVLLKVFLPYIYWNTVFDNSRVIAEMGSVPEPFSKYCFPLMKFSRENHFQYPYKDWPADSAKSSTEAHPQGAAR
jgi:thioester reductase-like protein